MLKLYVLSVTTDNHDSPAKENLGIFSSAQEACDAWKEYGINILIEEFILDKIPTATLEYILPSYRTP